MIKVLIKLVPMGWGVVIALLLLFGLYLLSDSIYRAKRTKTTGNHSQNSTKSGSNEPSGKTTEYWLIITEREALVGTKKTLMRNDKRLELKIPAGTRSNQKIRLPGALEITDKCKGDIIATIVFEKDVQDLGYNCYPRVKLINNPQASKPTIGQLKAFCYGYDNGKIYVPRIYVCTNFAERFHNVAEKTAIRTAYVVVEFYSGELHALNLIETDKGQFIYIDSTSGIVCFVDVIPHNPYLPKPVDADVRAKVLPMGKVKAIRQIIW